MKQQKYRVVFVIEKVPEGEEPGIDLVVKGPKMWLGMDKHAYGYIVGSYTKREMYQEIRRRMKKIGKS